MLPNDIPAKMSVGKSALVKEHDSGCVISMIGTRQREQCELRENTKSDNSVGGRVSIATSSYELFES